MKKILICSLGTSDRDKDYKKANYQIDNKLHENKKSIAQVLYNQLYINKLFLIVKQSILEIIFNEFGGIDKKEEIYFKETRNLQDFFALAEKQINKTLETNGLKCFIIKYNINEQELWKNFEIHLDITRSFCSLYLMRVIMSEFISKFQETLLYIKGVYYGIFEFSNKNNIITKILNLSMFFELLRCSMAIKILKLSKNSREILAFMQKTNREKNPKNTFTSFSTSFKSDIKSIKKAFAQLKTKIFLFKSSDSKIYILICDELENFVKILDIQDLFLFDIWHEQNQNYILVYIVLAETILTAVRKKGININKNFENKIKKT